MTKHLFEGIVVAGKGKGKHLGFPTLNVSVHPYEEIETGVYVGYTVFEKRFLPSVVHLGSAKTFGDENIILESHVLDWRKEAHGKKIKVQLLKKIRDSKKFQSVEDLKEAIGKDVDAARNYFESKT